jgi:hypothetical protein
VQRQPSSNATLVHLVIGSGHQDRAYFEPSTLFDRWLEVRLDAPVRRVTSAALGQELPFEQAEGVVRVTVPKLELLELLVFE